MGKYVTIQLPADLVSELIEPLMEKTKLGFSSRAEVVKASIRLLYEKHIGWKEEKK